MCSLQDINATGLMTSYKPKLKLEDLLPNTVHTILHIILVSGKFGPCVLVELENNIVFLPRRFNQTITEANLEELNSKKLGLVFRGMKKTNHPLPTPLLELVEL